MQYEDIAQNAKVPGFFLALESLVYFLENFPSGFQTLFNNSQTKQYPLCTVACKLAHAFAASIGIEKQQLSFPYHFSSVFCFPLFTHDEFAFETVFSIGLHLFDQKWGDKPVNEVVDLTINQLREFLENPPNESVPYIYEMMLFSLGIKIQFRPSFQIPIFLYFRKQNQPDNKCRQLCGDKGSVKVKQENF